MPPKDNTNLVSLSAKLSKLLYAAIPYSFKPPSLDLESKIVTEYPLIESLCAHDKPAGPPPTIATFFPLSSLLLYG